MMYKNALIFGFVAMLVFGCSHRQKKAESNAAVSASTPAKSEALQSAATPSAVGQPAAKSEAPKNGLQCARAKETRTLNVEASQPKGCKLFYSNHMNGQDAIAWSAHSSAHCENVRDRIRTRLEEAGFKCSAEAASGPAALPKATDAKAETPKK